jgi:hypothetical protein
MMATYNFGKVWVRSCRRGRCAACGRRTQQTIKLWQTINPFNKNSSGLPKSHEEILRELNAELVQKTSTLLLCSGCRTREVRRCHE